MNARPCVLVTGCSSGFGLAMIRPFLERGWDVIATMRDADERHALLAAEFASFGQERLRLLPLDVRSAAERGAIATHIAQEREGRLDCLVNNAGQGLFGAFEDLSEDQLRGQMDVNFFGPALLTKELLPYLRSARGRIFNISSMLAPCPMPMSSAYSASKAALSALTESLRFELHSQGVWTCLVEPGGHRTRFSESSAWGARSFDQASPYHLSTQRFMDFKKRLSSKPKFVAPTAVAATVVSMATAKRNPPARVLCGADARLNVIAKRLLPASWYDAVLRRFFGRLFHA